MIINNCQILDFEEAKKLLHRSRFFCDGIVKDQFINETTLFSMANERGTVINWQKIEIWNVVEAGEMDVSAVQLIQICFNGLDYQKERLMIITMDSYIPNKVFLMDYSDFEDFADHYDLYSNINISFVQPMDYIFFLLHQKMVVFIHHNGLFTQMKFGC